MKFTVEQRDLFTVPEDYYLVQCISADLKMGKGIAVQFNERYDIKNKLMAKFPHGFLDVDGCYQNIACLLEGRVLNLITKANYFNKPTYYTMEGALFFLREECQVNNIKKIAMPLIGCGLDKLEWEKVEELIKKTFKDEDIEILVCTL